MQDEINIIQLPDIGKNQTWINPSQFLCVNKKTKYVDESVKFIDFFVNDIEAGKFLKNDRGMVSSPKIRAVLRENASPIEKKIYDFWDTASAHTSPRDLLPPADDEFDNGIKFISQRVAFGQVTIQQGAKELFELAQKVCTK
jgi:multiple sugar transport system substrate-binding protein